jgi:hypothetical protein
VRQWVLCKPLCGKGILYYLSFSNDSFSAGSCYLLAGTSRDNRLYLFLVVRFAKEVVHSRAFSGFEDSAVWATATQILWMNRT